MPFLNTGGIKQIIEDGETSSLASGQGRCAMLTVLTFERQFK
jgi:hypothetical protein